MNSVAPTAPRHPTTRPWLHASLLGILLCLAILPHSSQATIFGWGNNNNLQTQIPPGVSNALALAGGTIHSLALKPDGTVAGWGDNLFGQTNVTSGLSNVIAVAGGDTFSLLLLSNGTVVVRGTQSAPPDGLTNVIAIAAGWRHGLALKQDGSVISWGDTNSVPEGLSNVVAIAAGDGHSLALLNDRTVTAWGDPAFDKTVIPPGLSNVVAIAAGKDHCLALQQTGQLVAWGRNEDGQATVPPSLTNVVAISAGAFHNLALRPNGTVAAWGNSIFNQAAAPALSGFRRIAAGGYHNLGLIGDGSPVITLQPRSQMTPINRDVVFVALAVGSPPPIYQWRKNDADLAGQTNSMLILTNVQPENAGDYSVRVANAKGTVNSANATLTPFIDPPVVTLQPQDAETLCGLDAEFQVSAEGFTPLSYQWNYEGEPIEGATNTNLILPETTLDQTGGYSVVITNIAGSVTSVVASLTVVALPPEIQDAPEDFTAICGTHATFIVTAQSINPMNYQWLFNGEPIAEATQTWLILDNVTTNQAGEYAVIVADQCGAVTSAVATLTVTVEPPFITSPLAVSGDQGSPFWYQITGLHTPVHFAAAFLPLGLSLDPDTGVISGTPLEEGVFTPVITALNACAMHSETLTLTFSSGTPVITSPLTLVGVENESLFYQITTDRPTTGFGAENLPTGLSLVAGTGDIVGAPVFAGTHQAMIYATNEWGVDARTLTINVANRLITGLAIANVTYTYSSPYLLDFEFSLRDDPDPNVGNAVVVPPQSLVAVTVETVDGVSRVNSASETGARIALGNTKQLKVNLVLDFSESIANLAAGDANNDGISDAVEQMVASAQLFVNQQSASTQIGVIEFHREDFDPRQVVPLTTDKKLLNEEIAGIWTNYVQNFPASSRCWDALGLAIEDLGPANADEQHYVVFISDGEDESSLTTVADIITLATNSGVKIFCIGFGDPINTPALLAITEETQGRYYPAGDAVELGEQFALISKDLFGQYVLRWATLKRGDIPFLPSFTIRLGNLEATYPEPPGYTEFEDPDQPIIDPDTGETNGFVIVTNYVFEPYIPSAQAGPVTVGQLRLTPDAAVLPTAMTLRAAYVPRFVRQLRINYRANWPCTTTLLSTGPGEILNGWSLTETNDDQGGKWLLLSSPNPQSTLNSIPFASFGDLIRFNFQDVVAATNAFSMFAVDNTLYTNTGGQSFVIENTNAFITVYTNLPYQTPIPWLIANGITDNFDTAELDDPDGDGIPTWQEYRANTDPQDPDSKFVVRGLSNDIYGRYQIIFSTALNRRYRVESSFDLLTWDIVADDIAGVDADVTILDRRYQPWETQVFYRATVY